jgi:hypothetical protein
MTRFILGILACLLVQLFGWPRVERALKSADTVARSAYQAASEAAEREVNRGR